MIFITKSDTHSSQITKKHILHFKTGNSFVKQVELECLWS